jgi:hypothetical protein
MKTKEEAIEIALAYLKRQGYDVSNQQPTACLITRPTENNPKAKRLKELRPDVWKKLQESHRDFWSVCFDTGLPERASPRHFFVHVDLEHGQVKMDPAL